VLIEEMHEKGAPLERALPDAGIERIRPVMITVGASIVAFRRIPRKHKSPRYFLRRKGLDEHSPLLSGCCSGELA
jgi:hypothetical protein